MKRSWTCLTGAEIWRVGAGSPTLKSTRTPVGASTPLELPPDWCSQRRRWVHVCAGVCIVCVHHPHPSFLHFFYNFLFYYYYCIFYDISCLRVIQVHKVIVKIMFSVFSKLIFCFNSWQNIHLIMHSEHASCQRSPSTLKSLARTIWWSVVKNKN